jgi:hypothetical protein
MVLRILRRVMSMAIRRALNSQVMRARRPSPVKSMWLMPAQPGARSEWRSFMVWAERKSSRRSRSATTIA